MKNYALFITIILVVLFFPNVEAELPSVHLKMHLDKDAYDPGDAVHILLVANQPKEVLDAYFKVFIHDADFNEIFSENKPYEGKPVQFNYTIPQDNTGTHYWVRTEFSGNGFSIVKDAIIMVKTGTSSLHISDVTIDNVNVRPAGFINLDFKAKDNNGNIINPHIGYSMLCNDQSIDDCLLNRWFMPDEEGIMRDVIEIPSNYSGDYKLRLGAIPTKDSEYAPTEHLVDIRIEGEPLPNWLRGCGDAVYEICIDYDTMGSTDKTVEQGGSYPIHVKIQPNSELQVKVYDPLLELIFDETFQADNEGFVSAEYSAPEEAMTGIYNVLMIASSDIGNIYHQWGFHIGGRTPWGAPVSAGDILFQWESVTQEGMADQYSGMHLLNKTITISLKTVTPDPREIIPNHPVNITLLGPDHEIVDRMVKISDDNGNLVYTFMPIRSGHYKVIMSTEYLSVNDAHVITFPVAMLSNYTISAEGKEFPIIFEGEWHYYVMIKNVEFSQPEKRISFDVSNTEIFHRLQVRIPYELLNEPYVVVIDGEPNRTVVFNDYTSAVIYIPLDDAVKRVDIIGAGAISEFPLPFLILSVTVAAFITASRFVGNVRK